MTEYAITILVKAESKEEAIAKRCEGEFHAIGEWHTGGTRSPNALATSGSGTELKKLLARFGFKPAKGCKCSQHILEMNRNGPDWCEQNIDTIIGWLAEEAARANIIFVGSIAKLLILRAIRNARKESLRKSGTQESH